MTQKSQVENRSVSDGEDGMRLDRWFKTHHPDLPHSRLEKLLRTGQVRVDGGRVKASTRLEAGQVWRRTDALGRGAVIHLVALDGGADRAEVGFRLLLLLAVDRG